jgi:anti-sigma factor RsiW
MTPDERFQLIQRYYDGEAQGADARAAEALLLRDADAQALFASLAEISGAVRIDVVAAVHGEDFSTYWDRIERKLPKGPLTIEPEPRRAMVSSEAEPLRASPRSFLRTLFGPGLALAGAALAVLALFGPVDAPTADPLRLANVDQTLEVESIESDGGVVMVVQESAEVPAIVWFTEAQEG